MKRVLVMFGIALAIAGAAAVVADAHTSRSAPTTVNVSGKEYKFVLSRRSGPHGAYVFKFTNTGKLMHDFKIAGKKTPLLKPGGKATLRVTLKKGKNPYVCTFPGHAALGMKGVFTVT